MRQKLSSSFATLCCGLLLVGCSSSTAGPDTRAPETTTTSVAPEGDRFPTESSMRSVDLRPVLQMAKLDDPADTTPQDDAHDDVFVDDKGYAYLLGPSLASGYLVLTAAATAVDDGTFSVLVSLSSDPADLAAVEAAMTPCIAKAEVCPTGQLAFLADGELVIAPVVSQLPLEGELEFKRLASYEEATQLAARLKP
jgi:hypothetical protein